MRFGAFTAFRRLHYVSHRLMSMRLFLREKIIWMFLRCAWGDVDQLISCQLGWLRREFSLSICCPKACDILKTEMCPGVSTELTNIFMNIPLQHTFCTRDESGKYPMIEFEAALKRYARCVYCSVQVLLCPGRSRACARLLSTSPLRS